jgi:hypothetical protein
MMICKTCKNLFLCEDKSAHALLRVTPRPRYSAQSRFGTLGKSRFVAKLPSQRHVETPESRQFAA